MQRFFVSWIVAVLLTLSSVNSAYAQYYRAWRNSDGTYNPVELAVRRGRCPPAGETYAGVSCRMDQSFSTWIPVAIWSVTAARVQQASETNTRITMGGAFIAFRNEPWSPYYTSPLDNRQFLVFNAQVYNDNGQSDWLSVPVLSQPNASAPIDPTRPYARPTYVCSSVYGPLFLRNSSPNGASCMTCAQQATYTSVHGLGDHAALFFNGVRYVMPSYQAVYGADWAGNELMRAAYMYGGARPTANTFWGVTYYTCDLRLGGANELPAALVNGNGDVGPAFTEPRDVPQYTFMGGIYNWIDRPPLPTIRERCGSGTDPNSPVLLPHAESACTNP